MSSSRNRSRKNSRRRSRSRSSRNRSRNSRRRSRGSNKSRRRSNSPASGWAVLSPRSTNPRRDLMSKCGKRCFLSPGNLKYPICTSRTRNCKPDCRGILAAKIRASQSNRSPSIARRADKIGRRMGCSWANRND